MIQYFAPDSCFRKSVFRPNKSVVFDEPVFQSATEDRPFTETLYAEHRGFGQRTEGNLTFPGTFSRVSGRLMFYTAEEGLYRLIFRATEPGDDGGGNGDGQPKTTVYTSEDRITISSPAIRKTGQSKHSTSVMWC